MLFLGDQYSWNLMFFALNVKTEIGDFSIEWAQN
jgi:hypothetical protein